MTHDDDPWRDLRRFTAARIALGRAGDGLPTRHHLAFQLAHARARDAVHSAFDPGLVHRALAAAGVQLPVIDVASSARDRAEYLRRPDLGRRLDPAHLEFLRRVDCDAVLIVTDGLSAAAVHAHAAATVAAILRRMPDWRFAAIVVVRFGRVAIGDEIAAALGAPLSVLLIGERPGLTSADSLGAYLTHAPRPGAQNADRNCVSNIRPDGLPPDAAGFKIAHLMRAARRLGLSGTGLKDDAPDFIPQIAASEAGLTMAERHADNLSQHE